MDKNKIETLAKQLIIQTDNLNKKDIAQWRRDHQAAIRKDNPKRVGLYDLYDYTILLTPHVIGVKRRTIFGITQKKFSLVDTKTGQEQKEKTEIFETTWFKEFMNLALDSFYYGHSLVELTSVTELNGKPVFGNISLIPRKHVCPEYGVLLRDIYDEPHRGIPYRENFKNSLVEIGQPKALGEFLGIGPQAIRIKNSSIFWDNFAEKFGIPIVMATTASRDPETQNKINQALNSMGSNASISVTDDIKLQVIEGGNGASIEVFDRSILRAEEQISIALAGQTMSFKDGASRAQGEVHKGGFDEIKFALADQLKDVVNDKLIPLMILNGFPVEGLRFQWDDSYEYSPEELFKIENMALQYFEIDPKHFQDKYGIPIMGAKKEAALRKESLDFFA